MCLNTTTLQQVHTAQHSTPLTALITNYQVWLKAVSTSHHQPNTPALTMNGDVVTLGSSRELICVDGSTGELAWKTALPAECRSDPVVSRRTGLVIVIEHGKGLSAYDPVLGFQVWRNVQMNPLVEWKGLCVSPVEGNIYCLRTATDSWYVFFSFFYLNFFLSCPFFFLLSQN